MNVIQSLYALPTIKRSISSTSVKCMYHTLVTYHEQMYPEGIESIRISLYILTMIKWTQQIMELYTSSWSHRFRVIPLLKRLSGQGESVSHVSRLESRLFVPIIHRSKYFLSGLKTTINSGFDTCDVVGIFKPHVILSAFSPLTTHKLAFPIPAAFPWFT